MSRLKKIKHHEKTNLSNPSCSPRTGAASGSDMRGQEGANLSTPCPVESYQEKMAEGAWKGKGLEQS